VRHHLFVLSHMKYHSSIVRAEIWGHRQIASTVRAEIWGHRQIASTVRAEIWGHRQI